LKPPLFIASESRYPFAENKLYHEISSISTIHLGNPGLNGLKHLARLEAAGAELHGRDLAVDLGPHLKEVGSPSPPRAVLGMGNGIAEGRAFAANFAFSRHCSSPIE
jgi:hypothetical protein